MKCLLCLVLVIVTAAAAAVDVAFLYEQRGLLEPLPGVVLYRNMCTPLLLKARHVGSLTLSVNITSPQNDGEELQQPLNPDWETKAFSKVSVVHSMALHYVNIVVGWMYFVAWSISFYPQFFYNIRRRSVVGLNFDYLSLNLLGFVCYSFFNVGLFWVPQIQELYFEKNPKSLIQVQLNDVIFGLHAVLISLAVAAQCLIFERAGQRISRTCLGLTAGAILFLTVSLVLTLTNVIDWLTYLYFFSYVKLGVTLVKYIPQAVMNFRRKSTEGWSIGNVLLDFTGGSLSLLQMFIVSGNNDDWPSMFGNPTKFGLGALSILFDLVFILQHYVLYREQIAVDSNFHHMPGSPSNINGSGLAIADAGPPPFDLNNDRRQLIGANA